jgi:hypothetical protein
LQQLAPDRDAASGVVDGQSNTAMRDSADLRRIVNKELEEASNNCGIP